MADYIIDFDFDNDFTDETQTKQHINLYEPIRLEELIQPDNSLALKAQPLVEACTKHIQQYASRTKRDGERGFADDLVDARNEGATSPQYVDVSRRIDDLVMQWQTSEKQLVDAPTLRWLRARVADNFLGTGAIEPLRRDPRVTEILVTSPKPRLSTMRKNGETVSLLTGGTRVEVQGMGLVDAPGVLFRDDDEVLAFIETLIPGNPPTLTQPMQSATLRDGSRIEVAHRVVTEGESTFVAIRRHPESAWTLAALVDNGTISEELARDLAFYIQQRFNIIVSGGTGSGKTSLLNALTGFINPAYHLAIIEDTKEMRTPKYLYTSRRVARPGRGQVAAITIRDHIRASLRSRPDIIMIGEVRGPEALDALKAMNTGHEGSMTTCHANSAHDTVLRLETMISETGEVSESAATHAIASSVDLIIFQSRMPDGSRKVTGVYEVNKPPLESTHRVDFVQLTPIWEYDRTTGTWEKVGEISEELLNMRNLQRVPNPLTMDYIRSISALSGYVTPK